MVESNNNDKNKNVFINFMQNLYSTKEQQFNKNTSVEPNYLPFEKIEDLCFNKSMEFHIDKIVNEMCGSLGVTELDFDNKVDNIIIKLKKFEKFIIILGNCTDAYMYSGQKESNGSSNCNLYIYEYANDNLNMVELKSNILGKYANNAFILSIDPKSTLNIFKNFNIDTKICEINSCFPTTLIDHCKYKKFIKIFTSFVSEPNKPKNMIIFDSLSVACYVTLFLIIYVLRHKGTNVTYYIYQNSDSKKCDFKTKNLNIIENFNKFIE